MHILKCTANGLTLQCTVPSRRLSGGSRDERPGSGMHTRQEAPVIRSASLARMQSPTQLRLVVRTPRSVLGCVLSTSLVDGTDIGGGPSALWSTPSLPKSDAVRVALMHSIADDSCVVQCFSDRQACLVTWPSEAPCKPPAWTAFNGQSCTAVPPKQSVALGATVPATASMPQLTALLMLPPLTAPRGGVAFPPQASSTATIALSHQLISAFSLSAAVGAPLNPFAALQNERVRHPITVPDAAAQALQTPMQSATVDSSIVVDLTALSARPSGTNLGVLERLQSISAQEPAIGAADMTSRQPHSDHSGSSPMLLLYSGTWGAVGGGDLLVCVPVPSTVGLPSSIHATQQAESQGRRPRVHILLTSPAGAWLCTVVGDGGETGAVTPPRDSETGQWSGNLLQRTLPQDATVRVRGGSIVACINSDTQPSIRVTLQLSSAPEAAPPSQIQGGGSRKGGPPSVDKPATAGDIVQQDAAAGRSVQDSLFHGSRDFAEGCVHLLGGVLEEHLPGAAGGGGVHTASSEVDTGVEGGLDETAVARLKALGVSFGSELVGRVAAGAAAAGSSHDETFDQDDDGAAAADVMAQVYARLAQLKPEASSPPPAPVQAPSAAASGPNSPEQDGRQLAALEAHAQALHMQATAAVHLAAVRLASTQHAQGQSVGAPVWELTGAAQQLQRALGQA